MMKITPANYTLFGAEFSYYSGKTRSYLLHKRIPFVEKPANAWIYLSLLPRRVHAAVVPVVLTPEGEWLQDTSVIIDELEQRFPQTPVVPATPVQRLVAYLFELWGDEFLLPLAMHTRWNRPEHLDWYPMQAGTVMLPGWPAFMQRWMGRKIANGMQGHVQTLGFDLAQSEVLDRFGQIQLDGLNAHFAQHKFLLGDRPCLGDYGLIGPLYAHIGRDPLSKRDLIDTRPHLKAWIERMFQPDSSTDGEFLPDDQIPETLMPALRSIFDEMLPFLQGCADAVSLTPLLASGTRKAPRFFGLFDYPLAGATHRRAAASYPVWMAQRLQNLHASMTVDEQQLVGDWLGRVNGSALLQLRLAKVERCGLAAAHIG
jgi:glutathione S-transferase